MTENLVTIIIPTYNRAQYIQRAIDSCLKQTYRNIEIIIIDDHSGDNTEKLIKNYKDKKIVYHRNEENRGAPFCRNKGIQHAMGEYINFLDDDDILYTEKIELQVEKFKTSKVKNLGVVTAHVKYSREDIWKIKKNNKQGNIYNKLLNLYCIFGTESMLIKKEILDKINGFDVNLTANQEYDLSIRLAKETSFDYVDKVLSEKFNSNNQISFDFDKKLAATKYFYRKYYMEFRNLGILYFLFNWARFKYLTIKYYIGKHCSMKVYKWLK